MRAEPTERALMIKALALVAVFRVVLEASSFRRAVRLSQRLSRNTASSGIGDRPELIAKAVRLASGNLLRDRRPCLPQALALYTMFNRRGIESRIRIGVMKDETGKLTAHAWVEKDDRIMIGWLPDLANFTPMPDLRWETV
jgi:hypothetical protein